MDHQKEMLAQSAYADLSTVFEDEWADLTQKQIGLLVVDFLSDPSDPCTASGYAARIGEGNLASYVACLEAGERNKVNPVQIRL